MKTEKEDLTGQMNLFEMLSGDTDQTEQPGRDETPEEEKEPEKNSDSAEMLYTPSVTAASFLQKLTATQPTGIPIDQLEKRLSLLRN